MQLEKIKQECQRLKSLGGDTSQLEAFIKSNDPPPTYSATDPAQSAQLERDRSQLRQALQLAQPKSEVIEAEFVPSIPLQQRGGELALPVNQAIAPPIDLNLKALGQQCVDLLPPEKKTADRVQAIANLIKSGNEERLSQLYNTLVQNVQITYTNSTNYAPVHAPQTHLNHYQDNRIDHGYQDHRQETTIVYAPNFYEITYAPETTEIYAPHYETREMQPYYHPPVQNNSIVTVNTGDRCDCSPSTGKTRDSWDGLLWALTALLFTILAFGVSGGIGRVSQFNSGYTQGGQ